MKQVCYRYNIKIYKYILCNTLIKFNDHSSENIKISPKNKIISFTIHVQRCFAVIDDYQRVV